jgi:hypothetical protein
MNPTTPSTTLQSWQWSLLALVLWREARGCSHEQKVAVAHVITTRATDALKRFPVTLSGVICAQSQFTSIAPPLHAVGPAEIQNAVSWPKDGDANFLECCQIADAFAAATEGPDITAGATHYYTDPIPQVPGWADPSKLTLRLGVFHFYRL